MQIPAAWGVKPRLSFLFWGNGMPLQGSAVSRLMQCSPPPPHINDFWLGGCVGCIICTHIRCKGLAKRCAWNALRRACMNMWKSGGGGILPCKCASVPPRDFKGDAPVRSVRPQYHMAGHFTATARSPCVSPAGSVYISPSGALAVTDMSVAMETL